MPDFLNSVLKWVDHNRYLAVGLCVFALVFIPLVGCESRTTSISRPGETITREDLSREVAQLSADLALESAGIDALIKTYEAEITKLTTAYNARVDTTNALIEGATADLDRKDEKKAAILGWVKNALGSVVSGNPLDWVGLATSGLAVAGATIGSGAILDNRRKDKIIAKREAKA